MKSNQKVKNIDDKVTVKKTVTFNSESTDAFPVATVEEDKSKELEQENKGVPLGIFGDVRIVIQENGFSFLECFMCCAPKKTIFLPKLNESIKIVCPNCQNGMLKFGVFYKACPMFRPESRELFICTNCNYIYSPSQMEFLLSNQAEY